MAIKCVCFDLGGLLIGIDRQFVAREYAPYSEFSEEELYAMLMHQAPDNGMWAAIDWFDRGQGLECSDYDFYLKMVRAMKLNAKQLDFQTWRKIYSNFIYQIPEMFDLVKRIKGVRLGVISNLCRIHQSTIHLLIREMFDFFVYSYVEQAVKPEEPIYERAIRASGVMPYEILFHDDRLENLEAAAKLGIYTCYHPPELDAKTNVAIAEAVMKSLRVQII